ncbi:hypothetical protein C357_21032 [Citreicella sp. 357]|nr:hypothetical protein C357_21032 [Citreicella sp. 357]
MSIWDVQIMRALERPDFTAEPADLRGDVVERL